MRLELEGASLYYEQHGAGPDVVWISGGGGRHTAWQWQLPAFTRRLRCTTFDNRGIGETRTTADSPCTIAAMAGDAAALIEAVCEPPVAVIGHSMGAFIVLELGLTRPDLLRCAVASGGAATGGRGWVGEYMRAEVDLRRRGGRLDGMMALTHYAAQLYPAAVLGDAGAWARIRDWHRQVGFVDNNERSLIPQWQACIDFDVRARLPGWTDVPLHVLVYDQDVQAPPQYGEEVAALVPGAELHLFPGLGHGSLRGHAHEAVNERLLAILASHP
jgi:pimeloyl-ACP methyl ester carboxylesterase